MNNNRPSLDEIYNSVSGTQQTQSSQPTSSRSLDEIYASVSSPAIFTPAKNNKATPFRAENGNYFDNIIPDGKIGLLQGAVNFAGNVAGSVAQPFAKVGNTALDVVNRGVEAVTGRQMPQQMRITPGSQATTNPITGESAMPTTMDEQGGYVSPGAAAMRTAGAIGEGALNFVGGAAAKTGLTGLKAGVMPYIKNSIKTMAPIGAAYGLASEAQNIEEPGTSDTWKALAGSTALGAIGGIGLGAGIGSAGYIANKAKVQALKRSTDEVNKKLLEGDFNAASKIMNSPDMISYRQSLGINSPEDANKFMDDAAKMFRKEAEESSRSNVGKFLSAIDEADDTVFRTILENTSMVGAKNNKVNWIGTRRAMKEKERFVSSLLDDMDGVPVNLNADELINSTDAILRGVPGADFSQKLDDVITNIKARAKNGMLDLKSLNGLRTYANNNYDKPQGKALGRAIRDYMTRMSNELPEGSPLRQVILDSEGVWSELQKLKVAQKFLDKWEPERLSKNMAFSQQLAGALGYGTTNSFFGYLGGYQAMEGVADQLAKSKAARLYGSPLFSATGGLKTETMKKNLMQNLQAVASKEKAKAAAKAKEAAITNAKYTPPNQSLYEPYSMGKDIDMGPTPKPKKSTEPYIDATTGELVNPKTGSRVMKALAVLGGAGAAGSASAEEKDGLVPLDTEKFSLTDFREDVNLLSPDKKIMEIFKSEKDISVQRAKSEAYRIASKLNTQVANKLISSMEKAVKDGKEISKDAKKINSLAKNASQNVYDKTSVAVPSKFIEYVLKRESSMLSDTSTVEAQKNALTKLANGEKMTTNDYVLAGYPVLNGVYAGLTGTTAPAMKTVEKKLGVQLDTDSLQGAVDSIAYKIASGIKSGIIKIPKDKPLTDEVMKQVYNKAYYKGN